MAPFLPSVDPSPLAMLTAARTVLRDRVVVVDDVHLLDDASAALLHQLVHHREAVGGGDLVGVNVRRIPWWRRGRTSCCRASSSNRSDVSRSSRCWRPCSAVCWTARRPIGCGRRQPETVLLLREMYFAAQWVSQGDVWSLDGPLPLSPRLVELIEAHLAAVPAEERRVLELLAFGEPLDLAASEALDGLVTVADEGLRLAHPLYGEVLRAQCPPLRKRNHQRYLASVLDDPLRVAVLRLDSGTADDPCAAAGGRSPRCLNRWSRSAERLARAAWSVGGGVEAAQLRGVAVHHRAEEAEQIFAAVATEDDSIEVRMMRALNLGWGLGRSEEAAAMMAEEAHAARSVLLFDAGKYDEARALLSYDVPEEAAILAMIDAVQGRYEPPFPVIPPHPETRRAPRPPCSPKCSSARSTATCTRPSAAAEAHAAKAEWDSMRTTWAIARAGLARAAGRLLEARRMLREVRPAQRFVHLCELAQVEALLGNDARALLAEAEELVPPGMRPYGIGLWQARIWAGGTSPFEAVRDARAHSEFAAEAVFLHEAVRLGHASDALERLRELASTTTGLLVPVYAAHAEALVRNDSAALEEVAARFEEVSPRRYASAIR